MIRTWLTVSASYPKCWEWVRGRLGNKEKSSLQRHHETLEPWGIYVCMYIHTQLVADVRRFSIRREWGATVGRVRLAMYALASAVLYRLPVISIHPRAVCMYMHTSWPWYNSTRVDSIFNLRKLGRHPYFSTFRLEPKMSELQDWAPLDCREPSCWEFVQRSPCNTMRLDNGTGQKLALN